MYLEFSTLDENRACFVLGDATQPFANSLRRAMVSEVKTFAIEDIKIYDNTSALFDEILAHRIGLIPLKSESFSDYVPRDECSCGGEGCERCTVAFTMSTEGPKMVTSSDLISHEPSIAPAQDDIPIVKLERDQKVVMEARAELNCSMDHAKWQPVTICGYKNYPVISVDDKCDGCGLCVEACPIGIIEIQDGHVAVVEGRDSDCSLCRLCEQACLNSGIGEESAISIGMAPDRFIFTMECTGSLPASTIIEQGLLFLKNQADDLRKSLEDL